MDVDLGPAGSGRLLERDLVRRFMRCWQEEHPGCWWFRIPASPYAALPFDVVGCTEGRLWAWEMKVGSRSVLAHQARALRSVAAAGGTAFVVRGRRRAGRLVAEVAEVGAG